MKAEGKRKTIFIIELAVLVTALIFVIAIVTEVLMVCREHSIESNHLNESVILASNAAEAASTAPAFDDLRAAIASMDNAEDNVSGVSEDADGSGEVWVIASLDTEDPHAHRYLIKVTRSYERGAAVNNRNGGIYAGDIIDVFDAGVKGADMRTAEEVDLQSLGKPLYTLETGRWFREEAKP